MKPLFLCLALFSLFSCSKEKITQTIPGTWTIIESNIGTGTGFNVQAYSPASEITLEFGSGGILLLTGSRPGTAMSPLWEYDRYEIKLGNIIRFFQSGGIKQMQAYYSLNNELYLNYTWARCGYEEKFLKIK